MHTEKTPRLSTPTTLCRPAKCLELKGVQGALPRAGKWITKVCWARHLLHLTLVSGTHRMTKVVMMRHQPAKNRNVPHFIAHRIDRKDCSTQAHQHTRSELVDVGKQEWWL